MMVPAEYHGISLPQLLLCLQSTSALYNPKASFPYPCQGCRILGRFQQKNALLLPTVTKPCVRSANPAAHVGGNM